jgi:hypothetical protein
MRTETYVGFLVACLILSPLAWILQNCTSFREALQNQISQKLIFTLFQLNALTSPTGGGRSVGIVRSRTKATEFSLV